MTEVKDLVTDALQPVAWIRKNGIRFIAEAEPQDDSETALYSQTAIDGLRTENERLRAYFDWANGAAEEGWLPAQEVRKLRAQLAEAQRDSERLDWLDKHCTGASDSERYLPRKIYWGGGSHRDVRAAIDAAKGESA